MLQKLKPTIAIIDSGIGGLSVLNQLIDRYHSGNYIYFADNLYMPYGNKTKQFIAQRVKNIIQFLKDKYNPDVIILACNTASSILKDEKIDNVVCMQFSKAYRYLATPLTKRILKGINILVDSTLARNIENNIFNREKLEKIIKKHIKKNKLDSLESLVLGCTHYELVAEIFEKYCPNTQIINNSKYILNNIIYSPQQDECNVEYILSKQSLKYCQKLMRLTRR